MALWHREIADDAEPLFFVSDSVTVSIAFELNTLLCVKNEKCQAFD